MNEKTITISLTEYEELLRNKERIATVARMYAADKYFSDDNIKTILGINEQEGEND